jgi:hypothetical protein
MNRIRSLLLTGLTHGLALAAGWLGWSQWQGKDSADATGSAAAKRDSSRAEAVLLSGDEVLETVRAASTHEADRKAEEELNREFDRVVATMEVPEDLAAALSAEIAEWLKDGKDQRKPSLKIMALLYHWTARDMTGLMKWAESGDAESDALLWHCIPVFSKVAKDKGPEVFAGGLGGKFGGFAIFALAQELGSTADPARVLALKASLPEDRWLRLRGQLLNSWPFEQKDALVELAMAEKQAAMLVGFAGRNGAEGTRWLSDLMADESLDAGFREELQKSPGWKNFVLNGTTMPLDERLKLLGGEDEARGRDVFGQLAERDLNAILKDGRDWRHAFRHGEADAAEVLAAMSKELPELAARAPEALRNQLFIQLSEEDPERAMALLDGLPEDERAKVAIQAPRWYFGNIDPNHFLAALEKVPADTPELWDARLDAWNNKTPRNHARLDQEYVAWVRQLPPGVDREMALFSLANAVQTKDGVLAAELRGELTDAALKQRMEGGR